MYVFVIFGWTVPLSGFKWVLAMVIHYVWYEYEYRNIVEKSDTTDRTEVIVDAAYFYYNLIIFTFTTAVCCHGKHVKGTVAQFKGALCDFFKGCKQ